MEISLVSHSLDKHTNAIRKIFGWNLDGLDLAIQERLQQRIKPFEGYGDGMQQCSHKIRMATAVQQCSHKIRMKPFCDTLLPCPRIRPQIFLLNEVILGLWNDASKDADVAHL